MTTNVMRFTESSIAALPLVQAGDKKRQRLYFHPDIRGFGVCVGARAKTFFVQRDVNGRTVRTTIDRFGVLTLKQATEEAKALLVQMGKGTNPNQERKKQPNLTYGEALDAHLALNKKRSDRTKSDYRDLSDRYLSDWLKCPLAEITRSDCKERHLKIGKEHGPYVANHTFRVVRAVYNTALKENEELGVNPTIAVDWYPESRRKAAIHSTKLRTWFQFIEGVKDPIRRDWHLFVLFSGLRRGDAEAVRWTPDTKLFPRSPVVDFDNKALLVPDPKGGIPFYLPLSDFLLELLERRKKCEHAKTLYPGSPWVFPANSEKKHGHIAEPEKPKKNKKGEMVKVLPVPFTVHGLRNTFITVAESLDFSRYAIKMLVNHSLPDKQDVTAGYISAEVERLREPMQQITDKLLALCHGEKMKAGKTKKPASK